VQRGNRETRTVKSTRSEFGLYLKRFGSVCNEPK